MHQFVFQYIILILIMVKYFLRSFVSDYFDKNSDVTQINKSFAMFLITLDLILAFAILYASFKDYKYYCSESFNIIYCSTPLFVIAEALLTIVYSGFVYKGVQNKELFYALNVIDGSIYGILFTKLIYDNYQQQNYKDIEMI